MIKRTALTFFAMLLFTASAVAQPEYDRANRERAAADAANREHLRMTLENNRPVDSKWGSATGVFNRPASTSTTKSGWSEAEHQQYLNNERKEQARISAVRQEQYIANTLEDGGRSAAYRKYYEGLEFLEATEIYRLRDLTKKFDRDVSPYADYYLSFGDRYKAYLAIADTGNFPKVMDALEPFAILPHTALKGLRKLGARFPGKQAEIDLATIEVLKSYFGDVKVLGGQYTHRYGDGVDWRDNDYFEWTDLFDAMVKKYPDSMAKELAMGAFGNVPYSDPYHTARQQLLKKKEYRNALYKNSRAASQKLKEVDAALAAIMPKVDYWTAVLKKK